MLPHILAGRFLNPRCLSSCVRREYDPPRSGGKRVAGYLCYKPGEGMRGSRWPGSQAFSLGWISKRFDEQRPAPTILYGTVGSLRMSFYAANSSADRIGLRAAQLDKAGVSLRRDFIGLRCAA